MAVGGRSARRNAVFLFVLVAFGLVSFLLYGSLETNSQKRRQFLADGELELNKLELRLKHLEDQLHDNDAVIRELREKIRQTSALGKQEDIKKPEPDQPSLILPQPNRQVERPILSLEKTTNLSAVVQMIDQARAAFLPISHVDPSICRIRTAHSKAEGEVQMLDMYEILPFDSVDGGVWKQGWEIQYDPEEIKRQKKLEVIVIPHSHDDPGWIKTFERYYLDQVKNILDGAVQKLSAYPDMRFIYAEMSFFERWWAEADEEKRQKMKSLLASGQMEIVTGGWVMTDEANAHYFSMVTEMLEGHEWLVNHLGYKPVNHWSIDPFGLSPTMAYLMKLSNLTNMVLQRVHYSVKKQLAMEKQLEFKWRQLWSGESSDTDITTHVFPFYSYDVPHTCGPDPKICCQFDFKRTLGGGPTCPWNVPPQLITAANVARRAEMLADQYRKKAQLYRMNVLLIPLGDDFRYDSGAEWDAQRDNYKKLFDHINGNEAWNMKARFGTLADYFNLLHSRVTEDTDTIGDLPILSGDFFTYADRDDHYWSGYYTSRPFYKQMDRVLQHYLRTAEILYSLAKIRTSAAGSSNELTLKMVFLYQSLVSARRDLSLFQHHDGVTGTAKDEVVIDYGNRMLQAINFCGEIITASSQILLSPASIKSNEFHLLKMEETRARQDVLPSKQVFTVGSNIVLFNSLARQRVEIVCVHVDNLSMKCQKHSDDSMPQQQIAPVFEFLDKKLVPAANKYELCFEAVLDPFGFGLYQLTAGDAKAMINQVEIRSSTNLDGIGFKTSPLSDVDFTLQNEHLQVKFSSRTGFLQDVFLKNFNEPVTVSAEFISYGARGHRKDGKGGGGDDLSGAYLFLPDGPAKPLKNNGNVVVVVDGPLVKTVWVAVDSSVNLLHEVRLYSGAQDLVISNTVDVSATSNFEFAMRLSTSVDSGDDFYTDLNGFQMIRRRRLSKLPLQAHYYPMPGSAFIEDKSRRISLLGAQALGVASLQSGQLEVMLDRRLMQDDGRGLFQGVTDNKRTLSVFRLLIEPLDVSAELVDQPTIAFHSLSAHFISASAHYPVVVMHSATGIDKKDMTTHSGLASSLPCDVHVVTLRNTAAASSYTSKFSEVMHHPSSSFALLLHRYAIDCRSKLDVRAACALTGTAEMNLWKLWSHPAKAMNETSLTLLYTDRSLKQDESIQLQAMDVKTVSLSFE